MKKYRCYLDFEKEEQWLNEMAKQGWALTRKFLWYEFREGVPNDSAIKIDYHTFKTKDDFEDYCTLFRDTGWEHIAGTKTSGTQYFNRSDSSGDADIFSDISSKAARYRRLSKVWQSIAISYVLFFTALVSTNAIDIFALVNPKLLYLTPGLWEKTGKYFWDAFLFETPFAIMRGGFWFFFSCFNYFISYFYGQGRKKILENK